MERSYGAIDKTRITIHIISILFWVSTFKNFLVFFLKYNLICFKISNL